MISSGFNIENIIFLIDCDFLSSEIVGDEEVFPIQIRMDKISSSPGSK